MRRVAIVGVIALASVAGARPHHARKAATPSAEPTTPPVMSPPRSAPAPFSIDVSVVRKKQLYRFRSDGDHFTVRGPRDTLLVDRKLAGAERERLWQAARPALEDTDTQSGCNGPETFIAVSTDGKLTMNAICPREPDPPGTLWPAWRALIATCESLAGLPPGRAGDIEAAPPKTEPSGAPVPGTR